MRRLAAAFALLAVLALAGGCKPADESETAKVPLFPWLLQGQDALDSLQLRGAGNKPLVTLVKKAGAWRVAERGDWPADAGLVSEYLFVLSQAHGIEAKTSNPKLYSKLGVEPVSDPSATGSELTLSGKGRHARLLIGHEHPKFDSNYVRVDGQAQCWLTDVPVNFDRNPVAWLDRRLVDLPLARIARIRISGGKDKAQEKAFTLSHRDDRFRLDDAPSAAMHDSHQGDALAGALDQLRFDDLADDDGSATAARELQFVTVDGLQLTLQAWYAGANLWVRVLASTDAQQVEQWQHETAGRAPDATPLSARIDAFNQRFRGRRFQLPASVANVLMLSHEQILAGAPSP
jgi:hypothetical protein